MVENRFVYKIDKTEDTAVIGMKNTPRTSVDWCDVVVCDIKLRGSSIAKKITALLNNDDALNRSGFKGNGNHARLDVHTTVMNNVSKLLNIPVSKITGRNRAQDVVYARHFVAYILILHTSISISVITSYVGLDHSLGPYIMSKMAFNVERYKKYSMTYNEVMAACGLSKSIIFDREIKTFVVV